MDARAGESIEPFLLERYFALHEFGTPLLLSSSDCESLTVGELLALEPGADLAFAAQRLGYTESQGAPALRAEIAGLYAAAEARDVRVFTGAEEAIYAFVRAVLRPGERVVVQSPCYQSLESVARHQGCHVVRWTPAESGPPWRWSLDDLERLTTGGARAIVINTPHNPTGYAMPEPLFRAVARLADERRAILFSDEVYRYLEFDVPELPAACDLSPNAVSLGALAKSFGLPGLRVGWLATRNAAVLDSVAIYKDYLTICNAAPSEFLATLALRRRDAVLSRTRDLVARNRRLADAFFRTREDRFAWELPAAGPIAYPRLRAGSAERLAARALEAGLMLLPSGAYGDGDAHLRVGFGRANLPEALARFAEILDEQPRRA